MEKDLLAANEPRRDLAARPRRTVLRNLDCVFASKFSNSPAFLTVQEACYREKVGGRIEFFYPKRLKILYVSAMRRRFQRHDTLRLFLEIARFPSLSEAADALHMTKGALSYQIRVLEEEFQTQLLHRHPRGIALSKQGRKLVDTCQPQFSALEAGLRSFADAQDMELTVGLSSYFAARWLSPRLMRFMDKFPNVRLRLQPMIKLFDLENQGVDVAIRWGSGRWDDAKVEPFLSMAAWPVGNHDALAKVNAQSMKSALAEATLLRDHDDSNAWTDWKRLAGMSALQRRDTLIIPDPNVRVQAVIDGQGIALMDDLVSDEIKSGKLVRLSQHELSDYGYFLVEPFAEPERHVVQLFRTWLKDEVFEQTT